MNKWNRFLLSAILLFIISIGCQKHKNDGGTTTGNPMTISIASSSQATTVVLNHWYERLLNTLIPRLNALPPPASITDASGGVVNMTQAWIVIKDLELKNNEFAGSDETDGSEVSLKGPFIINLFDPIPTKLGQGSTLYASIQRIKMKLSKQDISDTQTTTVTQPSGLNGQSVYFVGQYNSISFSFSTSQESEISIAGANPLTSLTNADLLISVKISSLIKKINLSSITSSVQISDSNIVPASNPCPLIDSSAQDLNTCFIKGLQSESNLGKDENGDGEIQSNESSVH